MLHPQCSIEHQINLIPHASLSTAPSFSLAGKPSIGHDSSKKHVVVKGQTRHKNIQVVKRYATSNGGNNGVQRNPSMVEMMKAQVQILVAIMPQKLGQSHCQQILGRVWILN